MVAENESNIKTFKCTECSKEFKFNSERLRHEKSHSPGFTCETCHKKFSFVSALRRHQKQHERGHSVKCEKCNGTFKDEILLKRHIKYAHKGTFSCKICSSIFNSDQALNTHMKTHRPLSERRFKCSYEGCGKSFNFSHHLKHHVLTHTNSKQHFCNICGTGFIQSHHLKTHLKTHCPSEMLHCQYLGCNKKFSTEFSRKRHMAKHSKLGSNITETKPDSGISSDSNSCDILVSAKDGKNTKGSMDNENNNIEVSIGNINDDSSHVKCFENKLSEASMFPDEFGPELDNLKELGLDCKSTDCITDSNNCICNQITKSVQQICDFTPLEDSDLNEDDAIIIGHNLPDIVKLNFTDDYVVKEISASPLDILKNKTCKGCECESTCTIKDPTSCKPNTDFPSLEYRADGAIKIKDTFDFNIPKKKGVSKNCKEFIEFGTCKDAIGKCLMEGVEGCLCARMVLDNKQAMAQEIEDLTPIPNNMTNRINI